MKLLIVTQAVDREDPNLGAFYYWFDLLARRAEGVVLLAGRVGRHDFPANVAIHEFGKGAGYGRIGRLWKFWELFSRHFAAADAVLFHQIPEFVIASSPFLIGRSQVAGLWYAHGKVTRRLRMAERLVDHIFTSSEAGFRLRSKKVHHLGQAINTDLFSPAPRRHPPAGDQGLRLLTIGRISQVKNYEMIIGAAALLRDALKKSWTLALVGGPITEHDRVYAGRIETLIRENRLEQYVRFYGDRGYSDIPEILRNHDMFLNASATGSLDKAVLEAMAAGLTVVTSNEAYRVILPPQYFLEHASAESLAERITALADEPRPNKVLREIVVRDHGLAATMEKMIALLGIKV